MPNGLDFIHFQEHPTKGASSLYSYCDGADIVSLASGMIDKADHIHCRAEIS
jgi:hypothetical protein